MRLGKDNQAISLAVFLLFSASAIGQAGKTHKYQLDGNLQKSIVLTDNHSFTINYSISELNVENINNDFGSFYRISIPGHTPTAIPGKPEVPMYSRLISIPEGAGYKVKITEVKSSKIYPSRKKFKGLLFPAQEGETKLTQQRKPGFIIDKSEYAVRGLILSDTVTIQPLGTLRNKRLANLYVSPVRYNPKSNILEVITSMKIEISFLYTESNDSKSLVPESVLFYKSLDKGVLNYNPGDVIPGYTDKPVRMIILTDTIFRKHLEPYIRWKTQKGFKVKVLFKGDKYAGNTYTALKETLSNIYKASTADNPPPEYLLIVGDVSKIPYYGTGNITDMYYGEFDGNGDYIPEMYIGRLPVADTSELRTVIDKIIQYEKFKFTGSNTFFSRALVTAGKDASYAAYMNGQVKYGITNYLTPENKINEYHFYEADITKTTKNSIINLINNGISFLNYSGHGASNVWLLHSKDTKDTSNIYVSDFSRLKNINMYPFIISNACRTSEFNIASSFGNKMVLTRDKGAIGFIGCSNDSYWDEDFYWAVGPGTPSADPTYQGTGLGAYDRLFHTNGESPSDWYFTMGQIIFAGNLAVSASTTSRKKYYWETYNLVGDPSIIPILGKPDFFNIPLPDTLPNGIKSLSLSIDPFAYIAVSHSDTLWDASYASTSGSVVLDMPGISDDSCLIVITGQNKVPLIKTIYFSDITQKFINLTSTSINDSLGNGNGLADYGETFFLNLKVSNLGLTDAHGLHAKISSTSDWITIHNDSVFIGTLPARSEIVLPDNLKISVNDNVPDMGVVSIKLILKDQLSEKQYTIDICVHAPELQIINCIIDDTIYGDSDYIADPGETFRLVFKIRNQGSSNISGEFNIVSPDNDINILESDVKSGILKFGEITDIPILVKLAETVSSGSFINISSTLDCSPYLLNKDFSFRVGRIRESFEASSFNVFPWINNSPIPWTITGGSSYDGIVSARSGAISHNGTTSLTIRTTYVSADSVKFFYKVSSEVSYDNFSFKLNDTEILKKSGEIPWTKKAVAVPAGLNKMEWTYKKDNSVSQGSDCAWVDLIDFAGSGSVSYIMKDIAVTGIVTPQEKEEYYKEAVAVKVKNFGRDVVKGFYLAYDVNRSMVPVKQFFENSIPYNDSVTVTFKTKADLSKYGIYNIIVYGLDNNDDYMLNDTTGIEIKNTEIHESLSVFPNPFTEQFSIFINSKSADKLKISITNVSGIKLYYAEKDILSGKNEIIISDIRVAPSIYYLNIRGAAINKTIPVLKVNK